MHLLRANPNRGRACHSNDNLRMRLPFTRNPDALAGCDQPANSLAIQTQHPGPPLPSKKDEAPSFAHSTLPLCRPPRPPGKSPSRTACTRHRPVTLVFWGGSQRGKVECRHRAERYLRGFRLSCGRYLGSSLHPLLAGATRAPRSPAVSWHRHPCLDPPHDGASMPRDFVSLPATPAAGRHFVPPGGDPSETSCLPPPFFSRPNMATPLRLCTLNGLTAAHHRPTPRQTQTPTTPRERLTAGHKRGRGRPRPSNRVFRFKAALHDDPGSTQETSDVL